MLSVLPEEGAPDHVHVSVVLALHGVPAEVRHEPVAAGAVFFAHFNCFLAHTAQVRP